MKLRDLYSLILLVLVLLIPAAVEAQNGQKVRGDVRAPEVSPCPMLIQDDHVVKQVASATSRPALSNTVLPGTAKGRANWLASHVLHSRNHIGSKHCVSVEQ